MTKVMASFKFDSDLMDLLNVLSEKYSLSKTEIVKIAVYSMTIKTDVLVLEKLFNENDALPNKST